MRVPPRVGQTVMLKRSQRVWVHAFTRVWALLSVLNVGLFFFSGVPLACTLSASWQSTVVSQTNWHRTKLGRADYLAMIANNDAR